MDSTSHRRFGGRSLVGPALVVAFLFVSGTAFEARGSSRYCWGSMMFEDCSLAGSYVWPANRQPTFGAMCDFCPGPDAGACMRGPLTDRNLFSLRVGGQIHGTNNFEYMKTCGDHALFRYTGPVVEGMTHQIDLGAGPGLMGQQHPSFVVGPPAATEPMEAGPLPEAAPPVDLAAGEAASPRSPDASRDAGAVRTAGDGCSCALSASEPTHAGPALIGLAVALWLARRRRA